MPGREARAKGLGINDMWISGGTLRGRTCDGCVAVSQLVLFVPQRPGTSRTRVALYRVPRADLHVEDTHPGINSNRAVVGVRQPARPQWCTTCSRIR